MRVVLLPVKPRFAQAIMDGRKRVEYRKIPFPSQVTNVVVYASSPTQRILGYFNVHEVVRGSPDGIWRRYGEFGCIPRHEYTSYYSGAVDAVALIIGTVCVLPRPLPLSTLGIGQRAPQSYAYLSATDFEVIRNHEPVPHCAFDMTVPDAGPSGMKTAIASVPGSLPAGFSARSRQP